MSHAPAPREGHGPGAPRKIHPGMALLEYLVTAILIGAAATVTFRLGFKTAEKIAVPPPSPTANVDVAAVYNSTPELIEKGKAVFKTNCTSCHGLEGFGDGPAASALNPKPRNFHQGYWHWGGGLARVVRTITEGSPGTAMPAFVGIPLGDRIAVAHYVRSLEPKLEQDKPEDLAWMGLGPGGARLAGGAAAAPGKPGPSIPVSEAMKQLAEPEPAVGVALASLPSGADTAAAALYDGRCAKCHGSTGEGGIRVTMIGSAPYTYVLSPGFGAGTGEWAADPARFQKLVVEGIPGAAMPANGDLTRDQLSSLFAYTQMLRAQQQAAGRSRS